MITVASAESGQGAIAPLRIRRFRQSDLDVVWALHSIGLAQVGLRPGDGIYYDDDLPRIEEIYLSGGGDFLVGQVPDAGIVAMGALRRIDDQAAEMCRLRVHPNHQRRGYGKRMMQALEARALQLGYSVLRGDTTLRQVAALRLYQKSGWRELRREVRGGDVVLYGEKHLDGGIY